MALQTEKSAKSLRFELKNRQQWEATLKYAREQAIDWRAPLTLIGRSLFRWSKLEVFDLAGPGKFQDLSKQYRQFKQSVYHFVYPILRATGALERSLTQPGGSNIFRFPNDTTLEWGTSVPYGVYHQSDAPRSKMPRRPFLLVTDARLKQWREIIDKHIKSKLVKPLETLNPGGTD